MSKLMQKLVFFIESSDNDTGPSISNLYMNRFIIDEDAGHEIIQIYRVEEFRPRHDFTISEGKQRGMG